MNGGPADADPPCRIQTPTDLYVTFLPVLDEELQQLPLKYRQALVLCYLEGKTHTQAARALGWPSGSMSRQVVRGLELLRS